MGALKQSSVLLQRKGLPMRSQHLPIDPKDRQGVSERRNVCKCASKSISDRSCFSLNLINHTKIICHMSSSGLVTITHFYAMSGEDVPCRVG